MTTRTSPDSAAPTPLDTATAPPQSALWTVRLLGAIEAHSQGRTLTRWPSRAAAQLLARLALAPERTHPREELVELLWPGVGLEVGRNRLRQVLSTLKTLLEQGSGTVVIQADRHAVRAEPGTLACDARDFERCLRAGDWQAADRAYRGELMPGFYDDWVIEERGRLATLAERLESMPRLPAPAVQPVQGPGAASPGQLPSYWTRLFGTEINATRLRELVRHQRLVTVLGAGGSGKTRLAVQASLALTQAAAWAPDGPAREPAFDQVVFVSLVDCTDAARALDAIAGALHVVGRDLPKGIQQVLAGQRTLLLLDNYEQLAGVADALILQLLTDTATLHVLITSRQRLKVPGAQVFELAGLPLPEPGTQAAADSVAGQAAVALFVDRARTVAADFTLEPTQTSAVVELVRLLAGMPLAIELAASRMRSLSPQQLLDLLADGQMPMLDLLAQGDGDGDGESERDRDADQGMAHRHASMRVVVAWSWRQLNPALISLMQALCVFAAPARAEALATVAGLALHTASERLEQLRDHSLVVASKDSRGVRRYVLLQPVREFVLEQADAGLAAHVRGRLRLWLIDFAQACTARGHRAIDDVEAELPHVYAAVLDAAADGPAAQTQAVELAVALRRHWEVDTRSGPPMAVMRALEAALPNVHDAGLRCQASLLLSISFVLAGLITEALQLAHSAVALANSPLLRSYALFRRALVLMFSGGDISHVDESLLEAVALAREAGELEAQALAVRTQFLVAVNRDDDPQKGEQLAQQVQALWEQVGHRRNAYGGLMDRASCWIKLGRMDEAATALAACEQVALQERFATGSIMSSWQLGRVALRLGQAPVALAAFRRCLQQSWDLKRLAYVADALVLTPGALAFTGVPGDAENAVRLHGFAAPHWQRHFGTLYRELARDVRTTRRWLLHHVGPARFETLRLEGACLGLAEAVGLGLGLGSASGRGLLRD